MEVVVPELGEGVEKAVVSYWYVNEGEHVEQDDDLVELATDKSVINIASPCSGIISRILYDEGETVEVGKTIAVIEEEEIDLDLDEEE